MITEQQLVQFIDTVFARYDNDRSGKLNVM